MAHQVKPLSDSAAEKFARQTTETGGATMGVRTGKLLQPGRKAYVVGAEPDTEGNPVAGVQISQDQFSPEHVKAAHARIAKVTGGRARVGLGAWTHEGSVYLDAVATTSRPSEAIRKGRNRGEMSVWDNKNMSEIPTRDPRDFTTSHEAGMEHG
jgi:hypothetical protein